MWILITLLAAIIIALGIYFGLKDREKNDFDNPFSPGQIAKRKEGLDKILALAHQRAQISSGDVQISLKIPETTATRYLEYLANLGKLSRIGDRGQQVRYQLVK